MRLLSGVLAGVAGTHRLTGDPSLSARPMDRVARPLSMMGVRVEGSGATVLPPLTLVSDGRPRAIEYDVPEPSAQVKSAVLFAALAAGDPSLVRERVRTRATTEEMLVVAGVAIDVQDDGDLRTIQITPSRPEPHQWRVPGDPSQAAFFIVAAVAHPDARVSITDLYAGSERWGFFDVLTRMGATITRTTTDGLVNVTASSSDLVGTDVMADEIPSLDEIPALAVAASAATGTTNFVGVSELAIKESDRLAGVVELVRALGADAHADGDILSVTGLGSAVKFTALRAQGRLDHRMVMAAAAAGVAGSGADIDGEETVASSFPRFFAVMEALCE